MTSIDHAFRRPFVLLLLWLAAWSGTACGQTVPGPREPLSYQTMGLYNAWYDTVEPGPGPFDFYLLSGSMWHGTFPPATAEIELAKWKAEFAKARAAGKRVIADLARVRCPKDQSGVEVKLQGTGDDSTTTATGADVSPTVVYLAVPGANREINTVLTLTVPANDSGAPLVEIDGIRVSATPTAPPLRVMKTASGTHFGLGSEKPAKPAPTLFIIANSIESMKSDPTKFYTQTARELAEQGWLYVVLDPACEGFQVKPGDPSSLAGWAIHSRAGTDFLTPYVRDCIDVLDHLVAEGYVDPKRVAVSGTSRGGFCALHFAAAEPRVAVVTCVSPVTDPLVLTEFAGVKREQVAAISLDRKVEQLADRTIWLSIGNSDDRVGTIESVSLAQKLVAAARKANPDRKQFPIDLIVGASPGHRAIDNAYRLETEFLQRTIRE